jgi:hypothetical protein
MEIRMWKRTQAGIVPVEVEDMRDLETLVEMMRDSDGIVQVKRGEHVAYRVFSQRGYHEAMRKGDGGVSIIDERKFEAFLSDYLNEEHAQAMEMLARELPEFNILTGLEVE